MSSTEDEAAVWAYNLGMDRNERMEGIRRRAIRREIRRQRRIARRRHAAEAQAAAMRGLPPPPERRGGCGGCGRAAARLREARARASA